MYPIELRNPKTLKPHERIRAVRVLQVVFELLTRKTFTHPILIDQETNVILDGHHRCQAAKLLRLTSVPCMCVPYQEDSAVQVYPRRKDIPVTKSTVLQVGLSNKRFPPKTTRHTIPPVPTTSIPIITLK